MNNYERIYLLITIVFTLSSCALLNQDSSDHTSSVGIDNNQIKPIEKTLYSAKPIAESNPIQVTKSHSEIELIWKVPEKRVTKYLINYGYNTDNLEFREEIELENLEQFDDGVNGQVYRYILKNIAIDKSVYLTITAIDNQTSSKPSEITTVLPN